MTDEQRERALLEALGELAGGTADAPQAKTGEVLLAAFRKRRRGWRLRPVWVAAAAAVVIAAFLLWRPAATEPARQRVEVATEFIPLRGGPVLLPGEGSQIIRIALPRREMRRFGIPVRTDLDESRVQADVLVGQDGMARAVRFIH